MEIRKVNANEKEIINAVVDIHVRAFRGFFLTFMGKGFLRLMYTCYTRFDQSDLLIATEEKNVLGFAAYSFDMSGFYRYMIKKRVVLFAWYSFLAFLRKPSVFLKLVRAFFRPREAERGESYVELASISVDPEIQGKGIGSKLIDGVKSNVDFKTYQYITLETDAVNNDAANQFYQKNGFTLVKTITRTDKRKMNEYRYYNENPCS